MKKFHRCHHGNLKRLDTVEVLGIVGDDMSGTRSERALEQQIILWIGKKGAPAKINMCFRRDAAKVVQKIRDLPVIQSGNHSRPPENVFILKDEGCECCNRDFKFCDRLKELTGGSSLGSQASDDDIRVQDDLHRSSLSPSVERSTQGNFIATP